ncbi:unnamed protein product [Withania somnifera]
MEYGENTLDFALILFILQLTLVVAFTRILVFFLKPFRQPRNLAEILGGVILGPSVLCRSKRFADVVFPLRSVIVLETMANIGLIYVLFSALAGMVVPFLIGVSFSFMLHKSSQDTKQGTLVLFLGVALSATTFPVLARILAELKLINTEIGRIAMSAALLNDIFAWILLAFAIAFTENKNIALASVWVLLSMIKRTPEGESINEFSICIILTGVMISGFITDAIGIHSIFGAFIFGLVIPNGPLGVILVERLDDFVSGLLLPFFCAINGLKTEINVINGVGTRAILALVIVLACVGKIAGTLLITLHYRIPIHEGITLGLLMNSKGLIEMIVINVGKDQKVLDDKTFAIMVIVTVIMTAIIIPIVTMIYKPARKFAPYKRRTIQSTKLDSEFRVLACIHTPRNVPTIINLLEASCPTKKSPICIYVLHLVELTGRSSSMLIIHNTRKSGRPALNRTQVQSDHIINAFENFEQHVGCVSIQPLTAISPYSTMHEDICSVAEEKKVVDGGMEITNPNFRTINQNVLANSPCSVGILVDKGLSGSTRLAANQVSHHVAVLFFGGPDDREALSYGLRMNEHSGINLTVMRFLPGESVIEGTKSDSRRSNMNDPSVLTVDYVSEFRARKANDDLVVYIERLVNHGEETIAAIRTIDHSHDLFIVGRGQSNISPLTAGLTDWSEWPELGAIGDLLASSDQASVVSVLVVQQYVGMVQGDQLLSPDSPGHQLHDHFNFNYTNSRTQIRGQQPQFHAQP